MALLEYLFVCLLLELSLRRMELGHDQEGFV